MNKDNKKKLTHYSGEFKQKVIADIYNNNLTIRDASLKYGINRSVISGWERIYIRDGYDGLLIERRGRASLDSGSLKGKPINLDNKVYKDIIEEIQHLKMENEYLKKLQALVQQEAQQKNKKLK